MVTPVKPVLWNLWRHYDELLSNLLSGKVTVGKEVPSKLELILGREGGRWTSHCWMIKTWSSMSAA